MPRDETVESFRKGFEVIRSFANTPAQTITAVADHCGISRAAARRFLLTLCDMGLARSDGKNFALTPAILSLGQAFLSGHSEIELIRESLVGVTTETGESASAAMLDGTEVVYIARSPAPHRIMTIALSVGTRLPAHATSMGQALLAYLHPRALERYFAAAKLQRYTNRTLTSESLLRRRLAEVRARGYALVSEELEVGLRALSIPVLERDGSVRFAINISAHSARISETDMHEALRPVLARTELAIRNAIEQRAQTDVVPIPEADDARDRRGERRGAAKAQQTDIGRSARLSPNGSARPRP